MCFCGSSLALMVGVEEVPPLMTGLVSEELSLLTGHPFMCLVICGPHLEGKASLNRQCTITAWRWRQSSITIVYISQSLLAAASLDRIYTAIWSLQSVHAAALTAKFRLPSMPSTCSRKTRFALVRRSPSPLPTATSCIPLPQALFSLFYQCSTPPPDSS